MLPLPVPSVRFKAIVIAGLALLPLAGTAVAAGHAPPDVSTDLSGPSDDAVALVVARDRSARAEATADSLKRALAPAHFADLMPETDRAFGLDMLRADYVDIQRKVAGYRATLGDHHPTLVAAEQMVADVRGQLLDAIRRGLTIAQRDAAQARSDVAAIEARVAARSQAVAVRAVRAADVTGSVRPSPQPHGESRSRAPDLTATTERAAEAVPVRSERPSAPSAPSHRLSRALMAAAVGVLAMLVLAWLLVRMVRVRRGARVVARRIEPALDGREAPDAASAEGEPLTASPPSGEPEMRPAGSAGSCPVLAAFPLPADAGPAVAPGGALARAADGLHATLRGAFGDARMTVLLSPADGLPAAAIDGAALALALAAAASGRRALLMETRPGGRLRRDLVAPETSPMLIEVGGTRRTLYRLDVGGLTVAVLPSDAGEAEAALAAALRPGTTTLEGLAAFDTVLMTGDAPSAEVLVRGADVALLVAPAGMTATALADSAEPLRATGRPCGGLLVEQAAAASLPAPPVPARPLSAPRRRIASDTAAPAAASPRAPLGLRGSFEPGRRRRGA